MTNQTVQVRCKLCANDIETGLTEKEFDLILLRKGCIQSEFPEIPAEIRELFISGICGKCWEDLFRSEEESNVPELQ